MSQGFIESTGGCWVARYDDWSAVAVFGSELEALRYAMQHSMNQVIYVQWGEIPR